MKPDVQLSELSDEMLTQLVRHALPEADIHEVMAAARGPMTWTPERLEEFVLFHRGRRGGLDGPSREISLAILVDDTASGVVRLQRVAPESLEVGMWLTRSARGRGIGSLVLQEMVSMAAMLGAKTLVAVTTATNRAAQSALARIGAKIGMPTSDGRVRAEIRTVLPKAERSPQCGTKAAPGRSAPYARRMKFVSARIITADVGRLAGFYERVTRTDAVWGNELFAEIPTSAGTLAIGSDKTVALFGAGSAEPEANRSVIVEFLVEDVDAEYERLRAYIDDVVCEPTTMPWGNRALLFRDPDGNLVNLFTPVTEQARAKFGV